MALKHSAGENALDSVVLLDSEGKEVHVGKWVKEGRQRKKARKKKRRTKRGSNKA